MKRQNKEGTREGQYKEKKTKTQHTIWGEKEKQFVCFSEKCQLYFFMFLVNVMREANEIFPDSKTKSYFYNQLNKWEYV